MNSNYPQSCGGRPPSKSSLKIASPLNRARAYSIEIRRYCKRALSQVGGFYILLSSHYGFAVYGGSTNVLI